MNDIFAQIASDRYAARQQDLAETTPPALPERLMPLDAIAGSSAFQPLKRLETAAELTQALMDKRQKMAEFLTDQAPLLADQRLVESLKQFDWREEIDSDRRDFASTLAGQGPWQSVTIPHYGPPLGRAVTYYRSRFQVSAAMLASGSLWAVFDAVDYKAQVFINGTFVGAHEGFFAPFEFEFRAHARLGENILLVKVENDYVCMGSVGGVDGKALDGDKIYAATGPGYDDPELGWHHCPAGMGIYQEVRIEARSSCFIRDLYLRPLPAENRAEAWVEVVNSNLTNEAIHFELSVFGQNFKQTIVHARQIIPSTADIRGHGDLDKELKPAISQPAGPGVNYYRLSIELTDFRLWELETPWLYQLQVKLFRGDNQLCDSRKQQFGMRRFRQDENSTPKGKFYLNEREIRLRGANTMGHEQQCVMRQDFDQLIDDILLAKLCNMNFLRLTQRPVQRQVYDYCDRLGLMTQTDLPLFGCLRRNQLCETVRQAEEMERLVRSHACNILVSYINEPFPNGQGRPHRNLIRSELEEFFQMANRIIRLANPERVIKAVDGDYDPPTTFGMPDNHCYCGWYIGHAIDLGRLNHGAWIPVKSGWHYGCGEFGSEGLDSLEVMQKYYPKDWLPQGDEPWRPDKLSMNQSNRFQYLWYPIQSAPAGWIQASQIHQAWVTRLMSEAFRRNPVMNSFAIHLFIDAWPCGWMKTIMDVDRVPKKAYFTYRDALAPLIVSLRSDRHSYFGGESVTMEAWICNDTHERLPGATLRYQLEIDNQVVQSGCVEAGVPTCSAAPQGRIRFDLPLISRRSRGTVRLGLADSDGTILADTAQVIELFPRLADSGCRHAAVVGRETGLAAKLARELGLDSHQCLTANDIILIDDLAEFAQQKEAIDQAVRAGATAVFLELPVGEHLIAGDQVKVVAGGMGERHFVDCGSGHPLVSGFEPYDCWFWHDRALGYPTPLLATVLDPAPAGWSAILNSGNGSWVTPWGAVPAAAEKHVGGGVYRIVQIRLLNRTQSNPAAAILARRLLGIATV